MGYERETAREVLRELHTRYPGIPLVVEAPSDTDADLRPALDGCEQLPAPAAEQIVAAVQSLLGQANEEAASGA